MVMACKCGRMGPNIKGNGGGVRRRVGVGLYILMVKCTLVSGRTIRQMALESIPMQRAANMLALCSKTCLMALVSSNGRIALSSLGSIAKVKKLDSEFINGVMAPSLLAIGLRMSNKVREFLITMMVDPSRVNGIAI